uniref:Transporter n=1 Tax=Knipowitschia caucasica TaxID=637954 RepID=A0AAV2M173_KNICA
MASKREQWSHKREYILASAGNVVGVGNIWRFPYLCYKNGGGVFLVPYCFFALFCGVPLFMLESMIGQYCQQGAVTCWSRLCPLSQGTGYSILMIQMFSRAYAIILAWALLYLVYCFREVLPWASCQNHWNSERCVELSSWNTSSWNTSSSLNLSLADGNTSTSSVIEFWERGVLGLSRGIQDMGQVQWQVLLALLVCWVVCYFCVWKGVRSTGKVVYVTAIFPYVMLLVLLVRGLTLPGAWDGLVFYLYPDPSRLADRRVWLDACSQVIFSYGLASGTLITLSSYNSKGNNCYRDSLWLCLLNSCTSFVAGFAVFSTLGFMAQQQGITVDKVVSSGAGLAFIAFPQAVALMPVPQLWATCFFIMLIMLGLDTVFSGLETITASIIDLFPDQLRGPKRREIFLTVFCLLCFLLQIPLTTSGGLFQFQLVDFYGASGTLLLFVSVVHCVAVGWAFGPERLCAEVENMTGQRIPAAVTVCWKYITPLLLMVFLVLSFMNSEPLTSDDGALFPDWAYGLGWTMALAGILPIPLWAVVKVYLTKGPILQRLRLLWVPQEPEAAPAPTDAKAPLKEQEVLLRPLPLALSGSVSQTETCDQRALTARSWCCSCTFSPLSPPRTGSQGPIMSGLSVNDHLEGILSDFEGAPGVSVITVRRQTEDGTGSSRAVELMAPVKHHLPTALREGPRAEGGAPWCRQRGQGP